MNADGTVHWLRRPIRLRVLRYTPLRDLVRGRLSGRLDLAALIDAAGLPEPLPRLIRDIARRTRLFRLEKVSVAEELVGHFRDGLQAGRPVAELVADFGDPARAALLIGRAKRRNRPVAWRASVRALQAASALLGLLLLLYGIAAASFFLRSPSPSVDYLAMVNAQATAGPPDERAWPEYRDALLSLSPPPTLGSKRRPRPGEPDWNVVEAYLEANAPVLERIRRAAARPVLGYEVSCGIADADRALWPKQAINVDPSAERILYGVLLPHLTELRELSALVLDDARRAASLGDDATTLADLEAALSMARQTRESGWIIPELRSVRMLAATLETAGELLARHTKLFTDAQLTDLAHHLSTIGGGGPLRMSFSGERLAFADLLQHAYTDDGAGDGRLTWDGMKWFVAVEAAIGQPRAPDLLTTAVGPALSVLGASRADLQAKYDQLMATAEAEAALPLWQRGCPEVEVDLDRIKSSTTEWIRYLPIALFMPALGRVTVSAELCTQRRDAVLVAIGLELFKRRHGVWPTDLDVLVPRYVPAIPIDRFDGAPIKYRLVDGAPLLYSSGSDGDDDGGRPPRRPELAKHWLPPDVRREIITGPVAPQIRDLRDGDWILWPPAPPSPLELRDSDGDWPIYGFHKRRGGG